MKANSSQPASEAKPGATSRREFIATSAKAAVGGAIAAPFILKGQTDVSQAEVLRVGLIGCGGRGSGAASEALKADKGAQLTSMGDVFADRLQSSLKNLQAASPDKVKVDPDHQFVGLDAYQKVIDSGVDVVILATPPGFRPLHLAAAVKAGKHVFCEKPMATDVPGVRSVLESVKLSKAKKTALVAGFCWRYDNPRREFYKRVHDGMMGEVRAVYATYLTGPVKPMPPKNQRKDGVGDLEWQLRNWYNFTWLSGDGLVEQACHSVDKIAWAMKDQPPVKAVGTGGRQIPNHEGNIFDHIDVFYEYENGVRAFMAQRQISGCYSDNSDYLIGSTGTGTISGWNVPFITGAQPWKYRGEKNLMYQTEHDELFASIRKGQPINDGDRMASSTLMAIMGRTAAYTGQEITWEQITGSQEQLVPSAMSWEMDLPITPMAVPGRTKFV